MNPYFIFYVILALVLIIGLGIQLVPRTLPDSDEHYIGTNLTRVNKTYCEVYWLGGWDYDSFMGDIRVNDIGVGHPPPNSRIYSGACVNITVEMYDRSAQSYLRVANYTGEV